MINRGQPQQYRVMLCCNDERGNFAGRVVAIDIEDEIHIACAMDRGSTIRFLMKPAGDVVKIGRRTFACDHRQCCVGNVFWDSVSMSRIAAYALVRSLLESGWVVEEHAEEGPFADLAKAVA